MGYSDLSVIGSDRACDAAWVMVNAILKSLEKSLKEKGNDFNTGGVENVAMIFHEFICKSKLIDQLSHDKFRVFAKKVLKKLEKLIKETKKDKDIGAEMRQYHLRNYRKWKNSLEYFIDGQN